MTKLVWVKFPGDPMWPSRMANIEEVGPEVQSLRGREGKNLLVYFFGSHDFGWVRDAHVHPFEENFAEYSKNKKRKKLFDLALREALKWHADPEKKIVTYAERLARSGHSPHDDDVDSKDENVDDGEPALSKVKKRAQTDQNRAQTDQNKNETTDEDVERLPTPPRKKRELTEDELERRERRRKLMRRLGLAPPLEEELFPGRHSSTKKKTANSEDTHDKLPPSKRKKQPTKKDKKSSSKRPKKRAVSEKIKKKSKKRKNDQKEDNVHTDLTAVSHADDSSPTANLHDDSPKKAKLDTVSDQESQSASDDESELETAKLSKL